jgi:hypothetical protein
MHHFFAVVDSHGIVIDLHEHRICKGAVYGARFYWTDDALLREEKWGG